MVHSINFLIYLIPFVSYSNIRDDYFLNGTAYPKTYSEYVRLYQYLPLFLPVLDIAASHERGQGTVSSFQNLPVVLSTHPYLHLQYYGLLYIRLLVVQIKLSYLVQVLERFPSFISFYSKLCF